MSVDQHKSLVSWFLMEAFNARNLEVVDRVFASDHQLHSPSNQSQPVEGIEAVKVMVRGYFGLVGEGAAVRCTVLRHIGEAEWVSTYYALEAVNLTSGGPAEGAYRGVVVSRFNEGKIQESFVVAQEAYPPHDIKHVFN